MRNQLHHRDGLNENNGNCLSPPLSRKQVRFENNTAPNYVPFKLDALKIAQTQFNDEIGAIKNSVPSSTLISKPFERIYMENIPNRHLDLSIIDAHPIKERTKNSIISGNVLTDRYSAPVQSNKNVTTNLRLEDKHNDNFLMGEMFLSNQRGHMNKNLDKLHETTRTNTFGVGTNEYVATVPKSDFNDNKKDEPTMKDMLKIIQQQNEQILILQKQVNNLLNIHSQPKQIEPPSCYGVHSTQYDTLPVFTKTPEKPLKNSKFAIDVMTSFEVSIRPQQNFSRGRLAKDCLFSEPKICEILEPHNTVLHNELIGNNQNNTQTTDVTNKSDCSLVINEPIKVPEECPSPENSIHVDMQDYSSEYVKYFYFSKFRTYFLIICSSEDEFVTTDLGWTIYNNIMVLKQYTENITNLLHLIDLPF